MADRERRRQRNGNGQGGAIGKKRRKSSWKRQKGGRKGRGTARKERHGSKTNATTHGFEKHFTVLQKTACLAISPLME